MTTFAPTTGIRWHLPDAGAPAQLGFTDEVDQIAYLVFFWGILIGLFLSLAVYDMRTQQRAHFITAAGLGWLALAFLVSKLT